MESSIVGIDSKNSANSMNGGRVRFHYELRKNLASRKSPQGPCRSSFVANGPKQEDPPKLVEESVVLKHAEPSKCLDSGELVGSMEAPKPETQISSEISMHNGSVELRSNVAKEQPPSPTSAAEAVEGQMPRRYPSRVRVSAVRNIPNGHGKDAMNSSKKDSPKTNKHSLTENAGDEKAQTEATEAQSISGKIEKEIKISTRKRKKEEEVDHKSESIERNEKDLSPQNEAGENLPIDQEAMEPIVNGSSDSEEAASRQKVMETLSLFETIYMKLSKGESKSTPDLLAYRIFNEKSKQLSSCGRYVGIVPGVEVGDEFNLRVELCIVGLHRQHRLCVDFTKQGGKSVAISIVYSRLYADSMRNSDVLVYSDNGDSKLEYANVALKNSMDTRTPVRVIHGFKGYPSSSSRETKAIKKVVTYIYDGLYLVEKYWRKKDKGNQYASMFRLKKMPGQPALVVKEVNGSKKLRTNSTLCIKDISQGKEKIPIRVVYTIDDEKPRQFKYIKKMVYPSSYSPPPPKGCECTDGCSDSESCACAVKNGGEIPFNCNGAIVEAKPLVYECGPSCKCPPSCHNRVSQHGIKFRLEIFKTESRGWGIRCREPIPSGSFVCEYVGELLDDEEAQRRTDDDYLFAIGNNYYDESLWEGLNTLIPDLQKGASGEVAEVGFAVDALEFGNVGRFINHSCTPNLYAQNLLYDHDNKSMPHVVLFAQDDIPPLQELTYDYNYAIDQVHDSDGNIKTKSCYCGSSECTGRLY